MSIQSEMKEMKEEIQSIKDNHLHTLYLKIEELATNQWWLKWITLAILGGVISTAIKVWFV